MSFSQIIPFEEVLGNYTQNENVLTRPSNADSWGGVMFRADPPIELSNGGQLKFYAKRLNSTPVNIYFIVEYRAYPNNQPQITLNSIEINSDDYQLYTIDIPPQDTSPSNFNGFYLKINEIDTPFDFQVDNLTFSSPPSVSAGTIVFNMEGKLYNDLETLNQTNTAEVSSIVQNALLSVFNISNVTIQGLQFNSIDVDYTSTGTDFDATNFEIYESDQENVVNAFVNAANNAGLSTGPYSSNDLTLTAVDSRGNITDPNGVVTAFTCFAAGSMVETDQGNIAIERLNTNKHTINGKKLVAITKNICPLDDLVCIEEGALGENQPSQKTIVSLNHLISFNGEMVKAKNLCKDNENVNYINNDKQILYNVLMEEYDEMKVNNMVTETLHPNNVVARLHRDHTFLERKQLISKYNKAIREKDGHALRKINRKI